MFSLVVEHFLLLSALHGDSRRRERGRSGALLRRFRKESDLPRLHPLIDLCNAVSLAYAVPIAVFDAARIGCGLEIRPATSEKIYETFSGETENPEPGEIIFADRSGRAHARRWTNRQSGYSAAELKTALLQLWPACKVTAA